MIARGLPVLQSRKLHKIASMLLGMALLLPWVTLAPVSEVAPRAHPLLLQMAVQRPAAPVNVIVQKLVKDSSVEEFVARLGGTVTRDLHIINAFTAELPAGAVPELSQAGGVRWVSPDGPVIQASKPCRDCVDTNQLRNAYIRAIGADRLWNEAPAYLQGQNIAVAVVDTGIEAHDDLLQDTGRNSRVVAAASFISATLGAPPVASASVHDKYGHGTHLGGIIGGNGSASRGAYIGVAPNVNLVNVQVSDNHGVGSTSDLIAGLQWVFEHKDQYHIRVVNLSLNTNTPDAYNTSPVNAAVEVLWFNGIVVTVAAGNNGTGGILYPPANDPFVITVGATDDRGTIDTADDVLAPYSSYGTTESGFAKPDLVAPGTNIVSLLDKNSELAKDHPDHIVNLSNNTKKAAYFRLSGTSMAAAVTAGAVALLLQSNPALTPDQVKYRLRATARPLNSSGAGAGYLDIYAAAHSTTTGSANTGVAASQFISSDGTPVVWNSLNWGSLNWGSLNWGSLNWGSLNWGSLNWGSLNWDN